MTDAQLNSALNLLRRLPPSQTENSLAGLIELQPELTDALLESCDQPLKVEKDEKSGRFFVLCDYNRDGDSYRSPWSNKYQPALDDGFLPSAYLRKMEVEANALFDHYRRLYFETGHSSVYFFDTGEDAEKAFGACFLVKKNVDDLRGISKGSWDSIHVFDVSEEKAGRFEYKLTTTVMISITLENDKVGSLDLSGSMTQQSANVVSVTAEKGHLQHLGVMVEDMELAIRNSIEQVYIQKTREVISGMRRVGAGMEERWEEIARSLNSAVKKHGEGRSKDSE